MKYNVPIHVRTSFSDAPGTMVTGEDGLEAVTVAGVAYDKAEARVHLVGVEDKPGVSAFLFEKIAEQNISVDMIIQNVSKSDANRTDVTFTMPKTDLARSRGIIEDIARSAGAQDVRYDEDVAKVSIVGLGMRTHAGVASKMFRLLANEGINIQAISTSEIKISCLVAAKYTELAVRTLHEGFGLSQAPAPKA